MNTIQTCNFCRFECFKTCIKPSSPVWERTRDARLVSGRRKVSATRVGLKNTVQARKNHTSQPLQDQSARNCHWAGKAITVSTLVGRFCKGLVFAATAHGRRVALLPRHFVDPGSESGLNPELSVAGCPNLKIVFPTRRARSQ